MQNSMGLTLTANGSGFTNSSLVIFNGAAQPTSFVSSIQLAAQIPPSSIAQPGPFSVTVQNSGLTSKPKSFYVVPLINSQQVSVASGTESGGVNIAVRGITPTLSLVAVGTGNSAGSTGVNIAPGTQDARLLLVGKGIAPGTFVAIGGNPSEIMVTQPLASDFGETTDNMPAVNFTLSVSTGAVQGPRDILVTNPAGEIAVFVGGLMISSAAILAP